MEYVCWFETLSLISSVVELSVLQLKGPLLGNTCTKYDEGRGLRL